MIGKRQKGIALPDSGAEKTIGGFTILKEIGRGGMATVYEVTDDQGHHLALKVLDAARSRNERSLGRFLREGEAIQKLDHPHIIKIVRVGQDGDLCFIAMELIDGPTLEDLIFELRRGRRHALAHFRPDFVSLPDPVIGQSAFQRAILESLANVANAVQAAHDAGLIHRDIKPSNILIGKGSQLILTDFGLVQDMGADTLTLTGDVIGTPLYMSPEQIAGNRERIGPKSDIYALGATIHETLGLNSPFSATDIAVLARQIARHEPRDLAELNPHLPRSVHTIVKRAMAKRPQDRYSQAKSISRDIELFLSGHPIHAKPPTPREQVRSLMRRNPTAVWCAVAAVGLIVVALSTWFVLSQQDERVREEEARRTYEDGLEFLQQELWSAAWRSANEVENELGDSAGGTKLRSRIESEINRLFAQNLGLSALGLPALKEALLIKNAASQLTGSTLDIKAMDNQLSESLVKIATGGKSDVDESALDQIWNSIHANPVPNQVNQWGLEFARASSKALAAFEYRTAFVISDRAQRWQLRAPGFPEKNYAEWGTAPFDLMHQFAEKLLHNPVLEVLPTVDAEDFKRLPWPQSRKLLIALLDEASYEATLANLRLTERIGLLGMAKPYLEKAKVFPKLRRELVAFWAKQPDLNAHEALVSWWPDFEGTSNALRLVKALKNPSPQARLFLEARIADADLNLLQVLAEVLGQVQDASNLRTLGGRLTNLEDDEDRQPYLSPFIQLGGSPQWSWVVQGLESRGGLWSRLTATLEDHPSIIPLAWSQSNSNNADADLRRIARRALVAHPETRVEWSRTILFDPQETMPFRVQIGLSLTPEESFEILKNVDLLRNQDAVLVGLSLWLDSALFAKGTPAHVKRVASLFEVYREGNDDLMKAWALHALARLEIPEFAVLIAKDLAAYEVDSTRSLLRDILGRSPQSLILGRVIQEIAKHPNQDARFVSQDVNAARCRFLGLMGRNQQWQDQPARQAIIRVLIECAARRDLSGGTRQAALRSLSNFSINLRTAEIGATAHYDVDGRVGAAAAVLIADSGKPMEALRFLDEKKRAGLGVFVAKAWILAKLGRFTEAIPLLEQAAMQGYQQNYMDLDFQMFPNLAQNPDFQVAWGRIAD